MSDPYTVYAQLRREAPVYFMERYNCWALFRFQDVWDATLVPNIFSAETGVTPNQLLLNEKSSGPRVFTRMDMPRQRHYRGLLAPVYSRRRTLASEGWIREIVRQQLAPLLERGSFDVYRDFADRISTAIIGKLVGLDREDAEFVRHWIEVFHGREPDQVGVSPEGGRAIGQLKERVAEIVKDRRARGDDESEDHIGVWLRASPEGAPMSDEEIIANVVPMMITGSEVIPCAVANCIYYLAAHPDQRAAVTADPSLIPQAFAESLRYDQPTNLLGRRLTADHEIRGETLRKGQAVLFLWASANRDEEEFEDADRFDIHRSVKRDLSYGRGIHKRIGEHLGNLEGRVMLEEILGAVADFSLDPDQAVRSYGEFIHGYSRVPISFSPRKLSE